MGEKTFKGTKKYLIMCYLFRIHCNYYIVLSKKNASCCVMLVYKIHMAKVWIRLKHHSYQLN